jgi:hypothetical protein
MLPNIGFEIGYNDKCAAIFLSLSMQAVYNTSKQSTTNYFTFLSIHCSNCSHTIRSTECVNKYSYNNIKITTMSSANPLKPNANCMSHQLQHSQNLHFVFIGFL